MDWVGRAHNAAMDDLRAVLKKAKPRNVCRAIETIAVGTVGGRREFSNLSVAVRRSVAQAAMQQVGCRGKPGGTMRTAAPLRSEPPTGFPRMVAQSSDYQISAEAQALVDQVVAAADGATTAAEVAGELAAITAQAQSLSVDDQNVVQAAASVSLSSFEYWSANAIAMADEMRAAYGDCVTGGSGESCAYETSWGTPQTAAPSFMLASSRVRPQVCNINTGLIWSGDKWGVGVGLAIGLMTRSVQGAIAGLVAGAVGGSGGAAVFAYIGFLQCAYK
jgi:hypothetical protein